MDLDPILRHDCLRDNSRICKNKLDRKGNFDFCLYYDCVFDYVTNGQPPLFNKQADDKCNFNNCPPCYDFCFILDNEVKIQNE